MGVFIRVIMQELKKIYSIDTKNDVRLGFVSCPVGTTLIEWEQTQVLWTMTVSKVDGQEEKIYFVKEDDHDYKFAGRLLSMTQKDFQSLVDNMIIDEKENLYKDYNYNKYNLYSPLMSLYSAALAAQFPIAKCNNPVILLSRKK
jgi:hypothetical protein